MPTHHSPSRPSEPGSISSPLDSEQLARFLYRPIVFQQPNRVVHPPSWLEHIPFAFWIVDVLRPTVFVELGTQSGNSYASFAQAIQHLGLPTAAYAIDTWQGDPQAGFYNADVFAEWAGYHDRHYSAFSRLIRSTFEEAVQHFSDGSIDLLHIDGYHTYTSASADFERWRPKLSRRGAILIHDINVREQDFGAWRLWEELKAQSPSFEFLHGHGLGVVAAGPDLSEALQWLFSRASSSAHDVNAVRQFFARLGGVVSARFDLDTKANEQVQAARAAIEARETRLAEQRATISQLTDELTGTRDELTGTRDELATAWADLEARRSEAAQAAFRISHLESQRAEQQEALRHKNRLAVEMRERLRDESERRRHLEELEQLAATSRTQRLTTALQNGIKHLTPRKRLRRLRKIARTLELFSLTKRSTYRSVLAFLTHPAKLRDAYIIVASGLFDEAHYRRCYPDVAASRLTPLAHFVLKGAYEGRNPHPLFDAAYYRRCNPDVAAAGVNPLIHYRRRGALEGRNPHPLFDVAYYLGTNPDVRSTGAEPLSHFLTSGASEGRNPNPFFDCSYYLRLYPDVAESHTNPLLHFQSDGWREGRRPSPAFDPAYYLSEYADVRVLGGNPLAHYLELGRFEGRRAAGADPGEERPLAAEPFPDLPHVKLNVRSLGGARGEPPAVLCLSHVMPWPPRAGNEYRIYRMLRWLQDQGYRIVPVIAPLPGEHVDADAVRALADQFSNAVLCDRDGRLEYVLRDVPDVLASLRGGFTRPIAALLDEDTVHSERQRELLRMDRTFCHDALITTVLRLHEVLGPHVLLAEYIWMSRILQLISSDVPKVVDTIDVFSTKREKVLQFGIDDLHVEPHEEATRLYHADLILAIQDEERQELQRLLSGKLVVTAGVDFDVVEDAGIPLGRRLLYVASDNPMNRKGLVDFLRFAWPHIRRDVPDAEFLVAGKVSGTLDVEVPGVIRLGPIADLRSLYRQARVVANPAVAGTGLKIKTLEALGHLRPIVTWPSGTDGLAPELAALCVTVRDWYDFSRRVAGLLAAAEPSLFSPAARDTIVRLTSPATVYRDMTGAIASLLEKRFGSELTGQTFVSERLGRRRA